MNNQITISKNLSPLKSILSLYFFTLGTCLLGFSTYLFLESLNITSEPITSWSGQSLFWSFILFFVSLFVIFLPVEFTGSYNLVNSSFRDLIVNVNLFNLEYFCSKLFNIKITTGSTTKPEKDIALVNEIISKKTAF